MLKVRRDKIQAIEDALAEAIMSSTTMDDVSIRHPEIDPKALTAGAMLAIQSVTMAVHGVNDIAVPSGVHHFIRTKEI